MRGGPMGSGPLGEGEGGEPVLTFSRVVGPSALQPRPPASVRRGSGSGCLISSPSPCPPLPPPQEYVAYSHTGRIIPAIWFRYDLSPITVKYTERRQPLYRFITTVSGWGACGEG